MKRFFLVVLCVLAFPVMASHIVGGEFEIIYVPSTSGYTYRVNLILYFDLNNGLPGARDPSVTARIFRKGDNKVMMDVFLPLITETSVDYTQPECSVGGVRTSKITYSTLIQMPPSQFDDPKGYYIVWERCCRNYNSNKLLNILSVDPAGAPNNPNAAGQTFYLEFPPVVKNGQQFINSSPQLFPPLSDYACINKPYYTDFAGTDVDGDSLAYSLVTPFNTHTSVALPPNGPAPAPYPEVKWKAPFSFNNILGGNPDLKISSDGLLTVTPGNMIGLYVFAVKCEEFRSGIKIGEVRRDFQMYVLDCPQSDPPQISGRALGETNFSPANRTYSFANTVTDNDRCIEVKVEDPDAITHGSENIKLRVVPIGFKNSKVSEVLPDISTSVLTAQDNTEIFKICFDQCPYIEGPFKLGIIAQDDACALPLLDTLIVTVNIEPPQNNDPYFVTDPVNITVQEGAPKLTWRIKAVDKDGDMMALGFQAAFSFPATGMSFKVLGQQGDTIQAELTWDPRCNVFDFTQQTEFDIRFVVEDQDNPCYYSHPDFLDFKLKIIDLPETNPPVISSSLTPDELANGITRKVFESLSFTVTGTDPDNLKLTLAGKGVGFALDNYNMSFPQVHAQSPVSSTFTWNITCDKLNLGKKNEFDLMFMAIDTTNKCGFYQADTLLVNVTVLPPDNTAPVLTISNLNPELTFVGNRQHLLLGQEIKLALHATDANTNPTDNVRIEMIGGTGNVPPEGYEFGPVEGMGQADTTFVWKPDCSIFRDGVYENDYTFFFRAVDNRCFSMLADTVKVDFKVKDIDGGDTEFLPPNIITPNGDGCNEYFAMEGYETGGCGEVSIINLPKDNCIGRFTNIRIYNRWGKTVFESDRRDFRWHARNESNGIYYYLLTYSHKVYKGSITVRY